MKKFKIFFALLLFVVAMPYVKAATASTSLAGNNSIKVGDTTTIYVKVNSSSPLKGVDLTYSISGNISVVGTSPVSGMTVQSTNGSRVLLYSPSNVSSGSSVFAITVKGNSAGTGTVSITSLSATINEGDGVYETAYGNASSYTITVTAPQPTNNTQPSNNSQTIKPQTTTKTQAQIDAEKKAAEERAKALEEKAKEEAEAKAKKEEENRIALNKATLLVEASEKSLLNDDYDAAYSAVNALEDSSDKTKLLERLEEVKFNIAVKESCDSNKATECKTNECNTSNGLLIVNVILMLVVIGEFIYIILRQKRED